MSGRCVFKPRKADNKLGSPVVSIVTPSLNQAKFLPWAIESVLSQPYAPLEYWVMDGGSQDGTAEILRAYGKSLRWVSEPDAGQADAVNRGWQQSRGEILGWVNADDGLLPRAVPEVVKAFAAHPDAAVVYGRCLVMNRFGKPVGEYPAAPFSLERLLEEVDNFIPQPATFVRRSAAEAVGWLDTDLYYVMDYDFWLRLATAGYEFVYLPKPLAFLRLHGESKTGGASSGFAEELVRVFTVLDEAGDLPKEPKRRARTWGLVYYRAARYLFWGGQPGEARTYLRRARESCPSLKASRGFALLTAATSLGRFGYSLASFLYGNPFVHWRGKPNG